MPDPRTGTTPAGAASEEQAAHWVRGMFGRVAHRYDLLNHLLSFQADRYWRARTVSTLLAELAPSDARVLDICCGTGDLMLALARARKAAVFGSDFCHPMLIEAGGKAAVQHASCRLFEADALNLPLASGSFDLITVAFGFRNFANYRKGLLELRRVLRTGGTLAILEFSTPPNPLVRGFYGFYSSRVLPVIGGFISGQRDAYTYLPESVRKFPAAPELASAMEQAGFTRVSYKRMTLGVVALHTGRKP
jgi:demethylmenaquinone methyltransferase/2-methoxy-6-polyprenyl-1,4-benzoquinol methylase